MHEKTKQTRSASELLSSDQVADHSKTRSLQEILSGNVTDDLPPLSKRRIDHSSGQIPADSDSWLKQAGDMAEARQKWLENFQDKFVSSLLITHTACNQRLLPFCPCCG